MFIYQNNFPLNSNKNFIPFLILHTFYRMKYEKNYFIFQQNKKGKDKNQSIKIKHELFEKKKGKKMRPLNKLQI